MHIVAFLLKIKEQRDIFCISVERLKNVDYCRAYKLTKKINFRVARPMFNRAYRLQRNGLVET